MIKLPLLAAITALALPSISMAGGDNWMTDFAAAKAKAKKENKSLLVDFTGSDWCGYCIKLDKEVFSHEEFKQGVAEDFILVEIDFPRNKSKMSDELQTQNSELKDIYNIKGFPTILIMDPEGRPYAKTGYKSGGPTNYLTILSELEKNGTTISAAIESSKSLEGVQKAEAYVKALDLIPSSLHPHYSEIIDQLDTLDPDDNTGFKSGIMQAEKINDLKKDINNLYKKGKIAEAPAFIEKFKTENALNAKNMKNLNEMKGHVQAILDKAK